MTCQILSTVIFMLVIQVSIARLQTFERSRDDRVLSLSKDHLGPPPGRPQISISSPIGKPATKDVLKGIPTKTETAKKIGENLPFLKVATRVRRPETPFGTGPKSDVVFIIDDSGSISPQDFQTSLSTLGQMITKASPSTKFAAVKYSSTANLLFQFVPPHEAKMLLRGPSHTMGSTNTQAALRMARTELFLNPNAGQCPGGKRIAVLVTDGMSNVHKSQTVPQANLLKSAGVEVFVIAVGQYSESGLQEMVQICSFPYQQHFFRVDSSRSFRDVVSYIPK